MRSHDGNYRLYLTKDDGGGYPEGKHRCRRYGACSRGANILVGWAFGMGGHLVGAITEVDGKVLAKVLNAKASDDALPA